MGELTDTNASFIASELPSLGITVRRVSQIGDNLADLVDFLKVALISTDIVLTTGGLGPTQDDLTREAIAEAMGEEMEVDPDLLDHLKLWFQARGTDMPQRNEKQATLIPSAATIPNNQGTAPGWWVEKQGKIVIAMPGPPAEMKNIWENEVRPRLKGLSRDGVIVTRNVKTTDLAEAAVAERLDKYFSSDNPTLGIYAKPDGIHLRIIARACTEGEAYRLIGTMEDGIVSIMGPHVWGYDDDSPEQAAAEALRRCRLTVATMESCTGGLLASLITDVPGSSGHFRGGIVAYSKESKIRNGVSADLIEQFGAISGEIAEAMASSVRKLLGSDVGIGVTGVAGPSKEEGKAIGTVFIAIVTGTITKVLELNLPPRRALVKTRASTVALIELCRLLN